MSRTATAYAYDYAADLPGQRHATRGAGASAHTGDRLPSAGETVLPKPRRRVWRLGREAVVAFVLVWVVAVAGALALVSRYAAMASVSYEMSEMKREISTLESQNETLDRQVAELKRPERIMELAVNKLNMVAPQDFQQATSDALLAAAQEAPSGDANIAQVAQSSRGSGLSGTLDFLGRGLARLLAGPARTEAKGK